jgi:hypothetical protein
MTQDGVLNLFNEKAELEQKITVMIEDFEERYDRRVEVDEVRLDRLRYISSNKAICKLTIKVSD